MLITIITLALAAAGFVWGRIRADIVALIALLVLTLSGILSPQEALSGPQNIVRLISLNPSAGGWPCGLGRSFRFGIARPGSR